MIRIFEIHLNMYFLKWFVILIIPVPSPALRINAQQDGSVNYEELVVDEKGENSVKDKTNKTKTPLIENEILKIPKHEEETREGYYMALNNIKFEDLIIMRNQIEDFIMNEIHNRLNSNAASESNDKYSHIQLEPDDIISEDRLKALGHTF